MKLKKVFSPFVAFSFALTSFAIVPSNPDNVLQKAGSFAMGGVGVAGTMSAGERALRQVLDQPDAIARLESMVSSASPAGKLYALLGLRLRDRAAYERALAKCRTIGTKVPNPRGCL